METLDNYGLSTLSTPLSTEIEDNFYLLTSTFTTFPQKRLTPITTIFIYKYLSPSEPVDQPAYKSPFRYSPYICQTFQLRGRR